MILEKLVNGEWHRHGNYATANTLAIAAFELGKTGEADQVKAGILNGAMPRVTLWVQLGQNWYIHGSYTDMTAMVRSIKNLCKNPDVTDFRVQPD